MFYPWLLGWVVIHTTWYSPRQGQCLNNLQQSRCLMQSYHICKRTQNVDNFYNINKVYVISSLHIKSNTSDIPWSLCIIWLLPTSLMGFPGSSAGKESTCNAGNPSSIPGLGRSAGEGIGYPLQYSWASLVAQLVKNLPAMCKTWVWSLGWEDPLEKEMAPHSSILAWRIPWTV